MGLISTALLTACLTITSGSVLSEPQGVTEILQLNRDSICAPFPEAVEERLIEERNPMLSYMIDMKEEVQKEIECIDVKVQEIHQKKVEEEQKRVAEEEAKYKKIANNIQNGLDAIQSPGANWCAKYVSQVYQFAGYGYPNGNADDMYYKYCTSSDKEKLRDGMIIAVPSWNGDYMALTYGHVGIYMNGKVWHNIGSIEVTSLDNWISTYGQISEVRWGFAF